MFLTPDEIRELTGYQRHADQRAWLEKRGWKFEVNAAGRPIVLRSYADRRLGLEPKQDAEPELDFSCFGEAA